MIKHNYIEKGEGEVLIMLHGNGLDSSYFYHQINCFSTKYRVIAVDSRGHGRTPRGDKPLTILQFSEDLRIFMDMHDIKKAHILGFSDGANVAIRFAIDHPERVDKLILNGANIKYRALRFTVRIGIELLELINATFSVSLEKRRLRAERLELMKNEPVVSADELKGIKSKTLVIAGTFDLMYGSHTKFIAEHIPDAQLEFIPGKHTVARWNYKKFNSALSDFLSKDTTVKDKTNHLYDKLV